MEFIRFGSSIPGSYWGCCACDIIQNFKVDPDEKASIQIVSGDGGGAITTESGQGIFAGPTWRDIFWQRLRFGTFDQRDMPNHAFIAILTQWQINSAIGKKWLEILREAGFEFIRTVNNSVYSGANLGKPTAEVNNNDNHIFGLFRNIGKSGLKDPFTPPKAWTDLPRVKTEAWSLCGDTEASGFFEEIAKQQHAEDTAIWKRTGKAKLLTEAEVEAAGAPVWYAGRRSQFPQQKKEERLAAEAANQKKATPQVSLKAALIPAISFPTTSS